MTDWRRFHRAAVAFEVLKALKDAALPIAVLVVAGIGRGGLELATLGRTLIYPAVGAAIATVIGLVRWNTTEWRVTETDIRRRQGIFNRQERSVPLARIQGLDGVRGPLQRLFGVVTLHVQTAGGGKHGEIVLTALRPDEALALHDLVGGAAPLDPAGPQRRLRMGGLLAAALTSGQTGVLVAIVAAGAQVAQQVVDPGKGEQDLHTLERLAPGSALGWAELGLAALALFWAVSIAGTLVAFSGFTLMRDGERLRLRRGLLSVRESSVPVRRVQAVRVVEGLLRQPFGLASLRLETLGGGDEPPVNTTLFPLVRRREVPALLREFLPEHATDVVTFTRPPRRALPRYVATTTLLAAVVAVPLALFVPGAGPWPLLAIVPGALLGLADWRDTGWRLDPDGRAVLRRRRVARDTLVYTARRAQVAEVAQSRLQRRAGLADFAVDVGPADATVRSLEAATAWRLWRATRAAAATPPPV